MNVWRCFFCLATFVTLRLLLKHLRDHSHEPNFFMICNIEDCPSTYRNCYSYYRHVLRNHGDLLDVETSVTDVELDQSFLDVHTEPEVAENNQCNQEVQHVQIEDETASDVGSITCMSRDDDNVKCNRVKSIKDFQKETAIPYLMNLREFHKIREKTASIIAATTDSFIQQTVDILREQVSVSLESAGIDLDSLPNLNAVFDSYELPFTGLDTTYKRNKFIRDNYDYIEPEKVYMGRRIVQKRRHGDEHLEASDEFFYYLPIIMSLKQFIQNENILNLVINEPDFAPPSYLCNTCDGSVYKNHPIFHENTKHLQISLYFDDLEICNPIGKSAGIHKIGFFNTQF